jgi:hypothetical protein
MARKPPERRFDPPRRGGSARSYTSPPIDITFADHQHRAYRIDLEIEGVFHGGPSYLGLVFLNNPTADAATPRDIEHGYAGSFSIFAHGGCLGDPGHCEVNESKREQFDFRAPNPLTPAYKRVIVTDAVRELAKHEMAATVTVVPVITAVNSLCETEDVFRFEKMSFLTYN